MEESIQAYTSHSNWRIRPANAQDAVQLAGLSDELGYAVEEQDLSRSLQLILSMRDHAVFVAVDAVDHVVGWVHIYARPLIMQADGAELGGLIVTRNSRQQGIGRALLSAAEDWALGKKLTQLTLRSNTSRTEAKGFYLALDFQLVKTSNTFRKKLS